MDKNEQSAFDELDEYFCDRHCHNGAWQTLKVAILAQQTKNTGSPKFLSDIMESGTICSYCKRDFDNSCQVRLCDDNYSGFIGRQLRA